MRCVELCALCPPDMLTDGDTVGHVDSAHADGDSVDLLCLFLCALLVRM